MGKNLKLYDIDKKIQHYNLVLKTEKKHFLYLCVIFFAVVSIIGMLGYEIKSNLNIINTILFVWITYMLYDTFLPNYKTIREWEKKIHKLELEKLSLISETGKGK